MIFRATHRHLKSGKLVMVVGRGRAEADLTPVVGYFEAGGAFWVRDEKVFADGRFERLDPPVVTVFAWVIEEVGSKFERPMFLSGVCPRGNFRWVYDPALAVRFARQQDAAALAGNHRVVEHGWEELAAEGAPIGAVGPLSGDDERSPDETA